MYIAAEEHTPAYRPGLDRFSLYKNLWQRHWNGFRDIYTLRFSEHYGPLDDEAIQEVKKLLACGNYRNGFRRHTCPACGTVLIVPFSCKSRLCLSCYRKKLFGWSIHLSYIINPELSHYHVTFTLPGGVRRRLFERGFRTETMIKEAAKAYRNNLLLSAGNPGKEWSSGIVATINICGNGLNYNPHVHLIGTREPVNTETGEIAHVPFMRYKQIRFAWMNAACRLFRKTGMFSEEEIIAIKQKYKNGFHVHFKPIDGSHNDILFRTAEYLAAGYFHNSQIMEVNNRNMTVTFRYKSWLDIRTKVKKYSVITMDIYEFMARMLYFLPKKHRKMIRYYGIYAHGAGEKLKEIKNATWKDAIEHSFNKNPETCPDCGAKMFQITVYGFNAKKAWKSIVQEYYLYKGYFRPKRGP